MKTVKVSVESFERMVRAQGKFSEFIKIPSSKEGLFFTGILMPNGAWVAWPQDLTAEEEALYADKYGTIPDIIQINREEKRQFTFNSPRLVVDENKNEPS